MSKYVFTQRIVDIWKKSSPSHTVNSSSVNSFKSNLDIGVIKKCTITRSDITGTRNRSMSQTD